jgi:hypothetical protein
MEKRSQNRKRKKPKYRAKFCGFDEKDKNGLFSFRKNRAAFINIQPIRKAENRQTPSGNQKRPTFSSVFFKKNRFAE